MMSFSYLTSLLFRVKTKRTWRAFALIAAWLFLVNVFLSYSRHKSIQELEVDSQNIQSEVIPLQLNNPWFEKEQKNTGENAHDHFDVDTDDVLVQFPHTPMNISGCTYREFTNKTAYSNPEFISEYVRFKECSGRSKILFTDGEIRASLGKWRELAVKTSFTYTPKQFKIQCDLDNPPKFLYFIFSRPSNFQQRDSIRNTWANGERLKALNHRYLFFIGEPPDDDQSLRQKLLVESSVHKDVLRSQFSESEPHFSLKHFASMLAWVYSNCELARYLVKITDTSFVNVRRFDLFHSQENYSANRIYGNLLQRSKRCRNETETNFVSKLDWPWGNYPPILKGPSMILSSDVIPRILVAVSHIPAFKVDQVFFTGLAALDNRIMRIGVNEFFEASVPTPKNKKNPDECFMAKYGVIENVKSHSEMESIWSNVEHVQEFRNKTCTIEPTCFAKFGDICLFQMNKSKKKDKFGSFYC